MGRGRAAVEAEMKWMNDSTYQMRLTRVLLVILSLVLTLRITLRYLHNRFIWSVLVVGLLALISPRLVRMIYLYSLVSILWLYRSLPFSFPLPSFLAGTIFSRGRNLIEVGTYAALLIWALHAFRPWKSSKESRTISSPYWGLLLLFVLGGCLAFFSGVAPDRDAAFTNLRQACFAPVALYIVLTNLIRTQAEAEKVMTCLLMAPMVLALVVVTNYDMGTWIGHGRYDLGFGLVVSLGFTSGTFYFSYLFILAIGFYLNARKPWQSLLALLACVLFGMVMTLMTGRGPWVGLAVAVPLVAFLSRLKGHAPTWKWKIGIVLAIPVGLVAALILTRLFIPQVSERALALSSFSALQADASWNKRLVTWGYAWRIWQQHPMGTGYMYTIPPYSMTAHGMYMELLLAVGPIGLLAYVVFFILSLRHWLSGLKLGDPMCNWMSVGAIGVAVVSLVAGVVDSHLSRFGMHMTLWAICGTATAAVEATKRGAGAPDVQSQTIVVPHRSTFEK